jgi:hypothetical protein
MIFTSAALEGIASGRVTLAFRRWAMPRVRERGELRTAAGVVRFGRVEPVALASITEADVSRAGFASRADLIASLRPSHGEVYRIDLTLVGPDPRVSLREALLSQSEREAALARLAPWSIPTLRLIADHPGRRAADLARMMGMETQPFKQRVRRLKALGFTESLEIGYRLSPRGQSLFREQ